MKISFQYFINIFDISNHCVFLGKYTNGVLLHSIVYVIVTDDLDVEKAKCSHNYSLHPIFRTRRCLSKFIFWFVYQIYNGHIAITFSDSNSSSGCCMIFIDDQSRIYQNWSNFVKNNKLPIGTMVAPVNGCYSLNNNNEVGKLYCDINLNLSLILFFCRYNWSIILRLLIIINL